MNASAVEIEGLALPRGGRLVLDISQLAIAALPDADATLPFASHDASLTGRFDRRLGAAVPT